MVNPCNKANNSILYLQNMLFALLQGSLIFWAYKRTLPCMRDNNQGHEMTMEFCLGILSTCRRVPEKGRTKCKQDFELTIGSHI